MTGQAIVVHQSEVQNPEVVLIEFPEGYAGFNRLVTAMDDHVKRVDVGGKWVQPPGFPAVLYESETECNTIMYLLGNRPQVVGWSLNEMSWLLLKSIAEKQKRENGLGRPASLIRPLQTWRKWTKKAGAII